MSEPVELEISPELRRARRRLLIETLAPHRRRLAVAAAAITASTAGTLAMPVLIGRGIDDGVIAEDSRALRTIIVLLLVAAFADYAGQRASHRLTGHVAEHSVYGLRDRLWRHVQGMSLDYFERQKTGRIVSRATNDVQAVYELFSQAALTLVSNVMVLVGITVILFTLDALLAAVVMAFVVPALIGATWIFKSRSEVAYRDVRERIALVIIHMAESLSGMRVVQAFSRERVNQARFDDVNLHHRNANAETITLMSVYGPGVELLGQVATFIVLLFGGFRVMDGGVTIGVLASFLLFLRQFFDPVQELSQFFNSFQGAAAGLEKVAGTLSTESTLTETPDGTYRSSGGTVRLDAVDFAYGDVEVLHAVDLTIRAGETLALIGPTGAGKSTIAKLVARFYDPTAGSVLLDGHDLRDIPTPQLRRAVAVVPQEAFLFRGSVHDNIALGLERADREAVVLAARTVGADTFIDRLPDGYDTAVDTRGARLSGGQRQLISFARALLVDPEVLILDEATSALDLPGERLIQRALQSLLADRTAIVIAHRLTSIDIADRIAVVDAGRIVELGTRSELLASGGRFASMHRVWEASAG